MGYQDHEISHFGNAPDITARIIGLAIKVHRQLGPGLLELVYEKCLCWELEGAGLAYARQVPLGITYGDIRFDCAYRADIVVEQSTILEIKAVERILPVHKAQVMTYLRLSGCRCALLLNFNGVTLKGGLRRFVR